MNPNKDRSARACIVTITAPTTFPAYPDPTQPTGWADVPAVLLAADLVGREDIEYTAMTNRSIITVDDAILAIAPPVNGLRTWLIGLRFDNGLADLDLIGLADPDTVTLFTQAEILLVTTTARVDNAIHDEVGALILVSNDPARWADQLS